VKLVNETEIINACDIKFTAIFWSLFSVVMFRCGGNITGKLEDILDPRAPNTGGWFLKEFQKWLDGTSKLMLCPGIRM
jgi:hypothetical protein